MKVVIKLVEFAGKPLLQIFEEGKEDKSVIQFGIKKAEAIVAAIDSIKKFVETKGKEIEAP